MKIITLAAHEPPKTQSRARLSIGERIAEIATQDICSVGDRLKALDSLWQSTGEGWGGGDIAAALDLLIVKVYPHSDGPHPIANKLIDAVSDRLGSFSPVRLASIAHCIVELDYFDHALFRRIADRLLPLLDHLDGHSVAAACYALAVADLEAGHFLATAADCAARHPRLTTAEHSKLAYSFAVAAVGHPEVMPILRGFLLRTDNIAGSARYSTSESIRLYRAMRFAGHPFPRSARAVLEQAFREMRSEVPRPNRFELQVRSVLRRIGLEHELQGFVDGHLVDFLIKLPAGSLALECDGDRFHRKIPLDRLRDHLLRMNDFAVLRIAFSTWKSMRNKDRDGWLTAKIAESAADKASPDPREEPRGPRVREAGVGSQEVSRRNLSGSAGGPPTGGRFRLQGPATLRVPSIMSITSRGAPGELPRVLTGPGRNHVLRYRGSEVSDETAPAKVERPVDDQDRTGGE